MAVQPGASPLDYAGTVGARAARGRLDERAWWLRALLVLQHPRPVFAALRDDSADAAYARQEPLLAIILLAGIAGVLSTNQAEHVFDDYAFDAVVLPVWAFLGGSIYGAVGYFVVGGLAYVGASFAGGIGSYRRARHVVGFAAAPLALSLAVWPVRLAIFGEDAFRRGGSDHGAADAVFEAIELVFLAWALALLAVGIRTVHGWSWGRSLAALALPAVVPALALARASGLL